MHKYIGVAIICNQIGQILIDRRLERGLMAGLWEFPGGKIEANETVEDCLKREIFEELAIEVEVGNHLITIDHDYSQFQVTLIVHYCRYLGGEPKPIECQEVRWVSLEELEQFTFPQANSQIIAALQKSSRGKRPFAPTDN